MSEELKDTPEYKAEYTKLKKLRERFKKERKAKKIEHIERIETIRRELLYYIDLKKWDYYLEGRCYSAMYVDDIQDIIKEVIYEGDENERSIK